MTLNTVRLDYHDRRELYQMYMNNKQDRNPMHVVEPPLIVRSGNQSQLERKYTLAYASQADQVLDQDQ